MLAPLRNIQQNVEQGLEHIVQLRDDNVLPVNGLTPGRIEKFENFAADESLVGESKIPNKMYAV